MISTEIKRLQDAKADIRQAIENKGVTVPDSVLISNYDGYIGMIDGGSSSDGDAVFNDIDSIKSALTLIKEVTIPTSWDRVPDSAFSGMTALSKVNFHNGIKSIGSNAFYTTYMTELDLPDKLESIGMYAFCLSDKFSSVDIPDSVTNIGNYAFRSTYLSSVRFPDNPDTTYGNGVFMGCRLTDIDLPVTMTSIPSEFLRSNRLQGQLTVPSGVTSIGDSAFTSNESLEGVVLPENLKSIGSGAFAGCKAIKEVDLPDGLTTLGGSAFSGCTAINEITIPDGVTSLSNYTFAGCSSLETVTIGAGVITAENYVFQSCSKLKKVVFRGFFPIITQYYTTTFLNYVNNNNGQIIVPCGAEEIFKAAYPNYAGLITCDPSIVPDTENYSMKLTNVSGNTLYTPCMSEIPEKILSGVTPAIASAEIGDCVESVGNYAFSGATSLTSIDFGGGVTTIGSNAAYGLTNLTGVTFGDSLESIRDYALYNMRATEVTLPETIKTIGSYAFYSSTLKTVTIMAKEPPALGNSSTFNSSYIESIYVPDESVDAYKNASIYWRTYFSGKVKPLSEKP